MTPLAASMATANVARLKLEPEIRRERILHAIETIMCLDDSPEFRVIAQRRLLELTEERQ